MSVDYQSVYQRYIENLKIDVMAAGEKAVKASYTEYFAYAEKRAKEIFNDAIQDFYANYDPLIYERSYSLYNVLETQYDPDEPSLDYNYNESAMTTTRSGGSLYSQIFEEGWHGGAKYISVEKEQKWGVHPHPMIPYWRTPHPVYYRWGRMASRADTDPKSNFEQRLSEANATEFTEYFRSILQKNVDNMEIKFRSGVMA